MFKKFVLICVCMTSGSFLYSMHSANSDSETPKVYVYKTSSRTSNIFYDPQLPVEQLAAIMVNMAQRELKDETSQVAGEKEKAESVKNEKSFGSGFGKGFLNKKSK